MEKNYKYVMQAFQFFKVYDINIISAGLQL